MKIIKADEYQAYFELINNNVNHLKNFFPKTVKAAENLEKAKSSLVRICHGHLKKEIYPFGVYTNNKLIGWISIKNIDWNTSKGEMGYFIEEASQGKGIMTSGVGIIVQYAFEDLNLEKLFIRTGSENLGSQKIALKNNFTQEGILRNEFRTESGKLIDTIYFGRLRND